MKDFSSAKKDAYAYKWLTLRHLFALSVIAILSSAGYFGLTKIIETQKTSAATINISGRQRMLSQRIALFAEQYADGHYQTSPEEILEPLKHSIKLMEKSHHGLIYGDPDMGLPGNLSKAVRAIYFKEPYLLNRQVSRFISEVKAFSKTKFNESLHDNPHYIYIMSAAYEKLLVSLDAVVTQHQLGNETAIAKIMRMETGVFLSLLLALVMVALFIFRPMVKRIYEEHNLLTKAERKISSIVKTIGEGVISVDSDWDISICNPEMCKIFGYSEGEIIGQSVQMLMPEDCREDRAEEFRKYLEEGAPLEALGKRLEMEGLRKDGSVFPIEIKVTETEIDEGGKKLFTAAIRDITERKKTEEELARHRDHLEKLVQEQTADIRAAKEVAEVANRTKSEFLTNMSHELRTPLHQILGFADLGIVTGDTLSKEKQLAYFSTIQDSGRQMLQLVEDLMDLSELDVGRMDFNMQENDIMEVVKTESMKVEKQLAERSLTLNIIPPEVKTAAVFDAKRIRQVLNNLFSNAIKFSPDGKTITVSFGAESLPRGDGSLDSIPAIAMTVRDEGVGIPEDELETIFDKFTQSSKTKTGAGGKGLGLAICKEIISAHKGVILAENHQDGGAVFKVILPKQPIAS